MFSIGKILHNCKNKHKRDFGAILTIFLAMTLFAGICQKPAWGMPLAALLSPAETNRSKKSVQEIYEAVAGTKSVNVDKYRATFNKDGMSWTIIGANAPIVAPIRRSANWPLVGRTLGIVVLSKPITNKKILPWTTVIEGGSNDQIIHLRGCPGEYEPASFILRSGDVDFKDVMISASDLMRSEMKTIDEEKTPIAIGNDNVDIRVVKCWYQAGTELWIKDKLSKTLTPELLLKDENIVQVNHEYQVNLVKNFDAVEDSPKLEPFGLGMRENKQVWLTIHIPELTPSGTYTGKILISADSCVTKELTIELEVLPFKLEDPMISYSMFYDASLLHGKDEIKMLTELQDMRRHGVYNPVVTMKSWNTVLLTKVLALRKKAGISNDVIYYVAWPGLKKDDLVYMEGVVDHCRNAVNFLKARGVKQVFFYGFDELKGDTLRHALSFYKTFQAQGAKTFVAGANDFFMALGPTIDIPIVWGQGGNIDKDKLKRLVDQAHAAGKKIWIYSFPQNGKEEPVTYKRNFGLTLWKLGIDGVCNYAYQAAMNNPWDDFDHPSFRDEMVTYPAINGPVSTIHWEGWREGIKDVKYLSTLLRLRNEIRGSALGEAIDRELASIDVNGDLDLIRSRFIDLIMQCLR